MLSVSSPCRRLSVNPRCAQDKNPDKKELAEEMFKKVAMAYETLSDDEKRAAYDRYGPEGVNGGGGFGGDRGGRGGGFGGAGGFHHDPFEIFREVFGGRDPFADFFGGGSPFADHHQAHFNNARQMHGDFRGPSAHGGPRGGDGRMRDPFDDMMGGGFGVLGGFGGASPFGRMNQMMSQMMDQQNAMFGAHAGNGAQMYSSSSSFSGALGQGGATSRSTSSQTVVVNGQRRTRTTTTIRHADGREETFTEEDDGSGPRRIGGGGGGRVAGGLGYGGGGGISQYHR